MHVVTVRSKTGVQLQTYTSRTRMLNEGKILLKLNNLNRDKQISDLNSLLGNEKLKLEPNRKQSCILHVSCDAIKWQAAIHKSENKFGLHKSENKFGLHKSENKFGLHKSENEFGLHKSEKCFIFVVWLGRFVLFAK